MAAAVREETLALLKASGFAGHDPGGIETIETHISVILLAGTQALKLKRPVRLPYVDFSTPERRLAACERELVLNRRTVPGLYRAVHRVTREADGRLAIDGAGALADAFVEMVRFDERGLLDRMALAGTLTAPLMTRLAHRIAGFHAGAAIAAGGSGAARMAAVLEINERALATTSAFPRDEVARFNAGFRASLASHADLLDARAADGRVRRCHGDLHLRNICLIAGEPTLFDCLEFDEELATTDMLYDLAFLLMDLWHRGMPGLANLVFNRYLDEAAEEDGLPLLPFFMAVRAAVRAHVTATQLADAGGKAEGRQAEARSYFDLARSLLRPLPARLVAVGGLSGSGKSTLAAAIAPALGCAPGARILASDRIRKRLFGVPPETRLPAQAYRPDVSRQVYARLARQAGDILARGHCAIADAVFDRAPDRRRIAGVAESAGVRFDGLWLEAGPDVLMQRVAARRGDPSDATPGVVRDQIGRAPAAIDWPKLAAGNGADAVSAAAIRHLGEGRTGRVADHGRPP